MTKTNFVDAVTVLTASFANTISRHNHRGEDVDGSNPKITLDELEDNIKNLLNDLSGVKDVLDSVSNNGVSLIDRFGGDGSDSDGNLSGTVTLDKDVYNFNTLQIASGTTVVNNRGSVKIRCKGNVTIEGTLRINPTIGYNIGSPVANEHGSFGYELLTSKLGSCGGNGIPFVSDPWTNVRMPKGGFGAGNITIEALGDIIVNGSIIANGEAGLGSIPTTYSISGSGGGSGGSIILVSHTTINVSGSLSVIGGRGSDAQGYNTGGGGGGSGGIVYLNAPNVTKTGTINLSGGSPGFSNNTGSRPGGNGGSFGSFGGASKQVGGTGKLIELANPELYLPLM